MGNEISRPELPDGRSRSLSPLPREDQLSLNGDDDAERLPSTMPPAFPAILHGSAPPGAKGSFAWHRRRRRSRGLSPESVSGQSRSPSPDHGHPSASQPVRSAPRAVSPDQRALPATQPELSNGRKDRSSKKKKKKRKDKSAETHRHDESHGPRERRSTLSSPLIRGNQDLDLHGSDEESARRNGEYPDIGSAEEGTDSDTDAIAEETSVVADHSATDFDDEAPPSAQPPRKRERRGSGLKTRKKRRTSRSASALGDYPSRAAQDYDRDDFAHGDKPETVTRDDVGLSEANDARSNVSDERAGASAVFAGRRRRAPAAGSPTLTPPLGSPELDGGLPELPPMPEADMPDLDYRPYYDDDDAFMPFGDSDHFEGHDTAVSEQHSPLARNATPVSPASPRRSHAGRDGRAEAEPAVVEHSPGPGSILRDSTAKSSGSQRSVKRKTKTPFLAREEEEEEEEENMNAFAELPTDDVVSPPRPRRGESSQMGQSLAQIEGRSNAAATTRRKKSKKQPAPDPVEEDSDGSTQSQYRTGPLTRAEQNQVIRAVERFRDDEDLTQEALNRIIHENPQTSKNPINQQLWATIQDACPSRPRRKLINWCRLRFHNFAARGTWTAEQDEELTDIVAKYGTKWSLVAGLVNRHPTDVRDRWRNYLVCRGNARTDTWSEGEEERFRDLVDNAIEKIRKGLKEGSRKSPEKLINWLDISEAMGYTRSRLQCMEKWKRMRAAEPLAGKIPTVLPPGSSWRLEKARTDVRKITHEDRYTLVRAVRDSNVRTDTKIQWKPIVNHTFGGKFERQALLVTWGRLRKAVPGWETMTACDCARYLTDMYEREGNFGNCDVDEADAVEDDDAEGVAGPATKRLYGEKASSQSKRDRKGKGKEVLNVIQLDDDSAPDAATRKNDDVEGVAGPATKSPRGEETSSQSRRDKKLKDKEVLNAIQLDDDSAPGEAAHKNAQAEDETALETLTKSAKKRRHKRWREPSPELDVASPQPSPSEEAEAARSKRREKSVDKAKASSAKGAGEHPDEESVVEIPPPPSYPSKKVKLEKRRRESSIGNDNAGASSSKKRRTSKGSSPSKPKVNGVEVSEAANGPVSMNGRRSISVISSDFDDMDDIPARLPDSSRRFR